MTGGTMYKYSKLFFLFVAIMLSFFSISFAATKATTDTGYLGNDQVVIQTDGDVVPMTDSDQDLGESGSEWANLYVDTVTITTGQERSIKLDVGEFIINDGTSVAPITTTSAPGLELDNKLTSVVWSDGETTPVMVSFKVPVGYKSGGAFRVFADESSSTTPNQIDFNVYVNKDGTVWDTSATNQTPVALAGTAGTPDMVALSVGTDFTSLAAGDVITLSLWRDDTATGTGDLEIYYAEFYYTAER